MSIFYVWSELEKTHLHNALVIIFQSKLNLTNELQLSLHGQILKARIITELLLYTQLDEQILCPCNLDVGPSHVRVLAHSTYLLSLIFFLFSFFLALIITFLTKGIVVGFYNFAWAPK